MARKGPPRILVVDDRPDDVAGEVRLGLGNRARSTVVHPRDVGLQDLEAADLVLVDYLLEEWPERDDVVVGLNPANGIALSVVFREHVDRSENDRLTAFALHSGHLGEVRARLPRSAREHLIARLNNLEWAFSKDSGERWGQMIVLARAVRQLPRKWPAGDYAVSETEALKLLGLAEKAAWFDRARRNVRACQPPIYDLSGGAHGLLFVRWMLHQVMPYPSFLWREEWVAARLRLTMDSLREIVREKSKLGRDLQAMSYRGLLAGFLGPRWWRAALEEYVWNLTNGRSVDVDTLHSALHKRTGVKFKALPADASIVCLDSEFRPTGEFISAENAVRLRPDQWPTFADDAWTSLARAGRDRSLYAVVDPLDETRVVEAEGNE